MTIKAKPVLRCCLNSCRTLHKINLRVFKNCHYFWKLFENLWWKDEKADCLLGAACKKFNGKATNDGEIVYESNDCRQHTFLLSSPSFRSWMACLYMNTHLFTPSWSVNGEPYRKQNKLEKLLNKCTSRKQTSVHHRHLSIILLHCQSYPIIGS